MVTATKKAVVKKAVKTPAPKAKKTVVKKPVKFVPPEVEADTWQDTIVKSAVLKSRAEAGDKKAGELLWAGAQEGINDWLPNSGEDVSAEGLYAELITLMGKTRKGDASKIAKVAVAVKEKGLALSQFSSLSRAYGAAREILDAAPEHDREDTAAEELTTAINESAPKSTSSVEGAAKLLLGHGIDETSRALVAAVIDAAGSYDKGEPVLRALLRSMSQEVAGVKPKPEPKVKTVATPKGDAVKPAAKAKPASEKAKPAAKAKPKPVAVEDIEDDEDFIEEVDGDHDEPNIEDFSDEDALIESAIDADMEDLLDDEVNEDTEVTTPEVPVKAVKNGKAKPIVRRR